MKVSSEVRLTPCTHFCHCTPFALASLVHSFSLLAVHKIWKPGNKASIICVASHFFMLHTKKLLIKAITLCTYTNHCTTCFLYTKKSNVQMQKRQAMAMQNVYMDYLYYVSGWKQSGSVLVDLFARFVNLP